VRPRTPDAPRRRIVAVLAVALTASLLVVPVASAESVQTGTSPGDTSLVVDLAEDGDATVTLRLAFDLDREEERGALERLRDNRTAIAAAFEEQMRAVADRTAEKTGREMSVGAADVTVSTEASTGVVELSVAWTGLAAVEGDRLVVSQPFADGFVPPGRFEVRAPEGYVLDETSPTAANRTEATAAWPAGSSLDGFQAAFVPADGATSTSLPGFGAPVALVAVALVGAAAALAARRRS